MRALCANTKAGAGRSVAAVAIHRLRLAPGWIGLARKRKYLNEMTYLSVEFENLGETDALAGKYSSIEEQHSIWR